MYVRRVHLENVCAIQDLELVFMDGEESQASTLFIGKNGTGKSSVLRAIALGLASDAEATALLAEPFGSPFVSVGQDKGTIELELVGEGCKAHTRVKQIEKYGENSENVTTVGGGEVQGQSPLVVAFGAGRSNEGAESSRSTYTLVDSTYMLFNYEGTFTQPELTLRRLQDFVGMKKYDKIMGRIRSALGLDESHVLEFKRGGGVVVSGPYREKPIPLHSWADGYRVTLNWVLDVYAWGMRSEDSIDGHGHIHGILLVDEIDQHLHPSMQRGIFQSLKTLFPKLQILASSHSPLVLQGANSHEIVSLHRSEAGITAAALRDYSGFSVEDLLTAEELFETPPYSKEVECLRSEYRSLIAKGELSSKERDRLRSLGQKLGDLRILSPQRDDETLDKLEARLSALANDSG